MKMAEQDHIQVRSDESGHGHLGSSNYVMRDFGPGHWVWGVERMVRDDNAGHILPTLCQALHSGFDLHPVDAAILKRHRPRRIDSQGCDFGVLVKGCEIVGYVAPISAER